MQKFVKEEQCCIIGWNVLGQSRDVNEITVEDIKHHIHLNPSIPSVNMPDLPLSIPFTRKSQNHLMNGFPSQAGVIPALVGAAKLGLDLKSVDFIMGGSAMLMLASGYINKGESFLAQRSHLGPVVILKSKIYMQNWMQTGFVFERVMTGRKPYEAHDGISVESIQTVLIGDLRVLFAAECDAHMNNNLVELKTGENALRNISKTALQMLSSNSSSVLVGKIEKKQKLQITSVEQYSIEQIIQENKEELERKMDKIATSLHTLQNVQKCMQIQFCGGVLSVTDTDMCILPDDNVMEDVYKMYS